MLITFGDSVCWGQGLAEASKFDSIVARALNLEVVRHAHSGASLGTPGLPPKQQASIMGEIPVASPTVAEQIASCKHLEDAELIILNGGINDVDVRRLVNLSVHSESIAQWTRDACLTSMATILEDLSKRLRNASARVIVVGYYPILSAYSGADEPEKIKAFLELHGAATGISALRRSFSMAAMLPGLSAHCELFAKVSDDALASAVVVANQTNANRFLFVPSGLKSEDALFTGSSKLWGLNAALAAEDEVAADRAAVSEQMYGDVVHMLKWFQCDRASVGHPNVAGAAVMAASILAALGEISEGHAHA